MSSQGTKEFIHPIEFCCINCSNHGSIAEIHIYSSANVFERSITILEALCEMFASPKLLLAQAENLDVTMCDKCAESVSYIYQAYTTLLSLSSATSYLCKAISQMEKWHGQKIGNENARSPDETYIFSLEEINEDGFEDDTVINDVKVAASVLEIDLDESDTAKQKTGILRKGKAHSKNPKNTTKVDINITEDLAQTHTPTPAMTVTSPEIEENHASSNIKRSGKYICRNINKRRFFRCRECPAQFIPVFELHDHILTVHEEKVKEKCPKCPFTYHPEIYKYETHRCISTRDDRKTVKKLRPHMCEICGLRFGGSRLLIFHKEQIHSQESIRYTCHYCQKKIIDRHKLYTHMEVHTETKSYLCSHCGKSFSQKRGLDKHIEIHVLDRDLRLQHKHAKEVGQFSCEACDKIFIYKRNLLEHVKKIHNPESCKYKCPVCEKPHWTRHRLEKHIPTHNPKPESAISKRMRKKLYRAQSKALTKPLRKANITFACCICSKQFENVSTLMQHEEFMHADPTICTTCGKPLPSQRSLNAHLRTHMSLEEKCQVIDTENFKCETCNKVYTSLDDLKSHGIIHINTYETPYIKTEDDSHILDYFKETNKFPSKRRKQIHDWDILLSPKRKSSSREKVRISHRKASSTSKHVKCEVELKAIATHFEEEEGKRLVIPLERIKIEQCYF